MLILAYDIQDTPLITEFQKFVMQYGRRLQYSVYEINNSKRVLEIIKTELTDNFEKRFKQSDSVLIFDMGSNPKIMRFGFAKNEESDLVFY